MDTVDISGNWQTNPTTPVIKTGKLLGRGTTDMKSGLAAMMLLASNNQLPKNTALLFYIDEEYNFAGIKKFIKDYKKKITPKNIISLDGSQLEIANGCRGLIEISVTVLGKSCHASCPEYGLNAIYIATQTISRLKSLLDKIPDPELETTSLNLACLTGGIQKNSQISQSNPNIVPDICNFILDIRPSSALITSNFIINKLKNLINQQGGKMDSCSVKHDFKSWLTSKSKLTKFKLPFKQINKSGYIDIQLLWQTFNQPICLTFGAGTQPTAHAPNEYIEINNLLKLESKLLKILNNL